jgi:hypothetical protein
MTHEMKTYKGLGLNTVGEWFSHFITGITLPFTLYSCTGVRLVPRSGLATEMVENFSVSDRSRILDIHFLRSGLPYQNTHAEDNNKYYSTPVQRQTKHLTLQCSGCMIPLKRDVERDRGCSVSLAL